MHSDTSFQSATTKTSIKPYRKYQSVILCLLIMFIFLFIKVFSFSQLLSYKLKQTQSLDYQLEDLTNYDKVLGSAAQTIEANHYIYGLNNLSNIDIIHSYVDLNMINGWIVDDYDVQYSLCYKATRDGDTAEAFITRCGKTSPLLVLIETIDGYRFGGFTQASFDKTFHYKEDNEAFLFSLDTKKKYKVVTPEKALNDRGFPSFGVSDISLRAGFLSNTESNSKFPTSYEKDTEATGDYILTGGVRHFQIKEMEVLFAFVQYSIFK